MRQSKNNNGFSCARRPLAMAAVAVTASLGLSSAALADSNWTGATSTDFNDGSNWSNGLPDGQNAFINTATGNIATISADLNSRPIDIFVGSDVNNPGRLDHTAGVAATGQGNWFFVGVRGGTGTYNLANTAVTGTGISGYGQGSGSLTAGRFWVGGADFSDNGTGTVNINTTGTLTATEGGSGIIVGQAYGPTGVSNAVVNLENGTVVSNTESFIGRAGNGTWNQTGGTFTSKGYLGIGREFTGKDGGFVAGNGTINLTGGTINSSTDFGFTTMGGGTTSTGTLNVGGTGVYDASFTTPQATANGGIVVGEGWQGPADQVATGIVTVSGSGEIRLGANDLSLGLQAPGRGTVNLDGGSITTVRVRKGAGQGTFNFNGGTLRASADAPDLINGMTVAQVRNGSAVIDTNGHNATVAQQLIHSQISGDNATDGGLTKVGAGTLRVTGVNAYTGRTTVKAGTLVLNYNDGLDTASTPVLGANGGGADVQGGRLVFDYSAGGTSPATIIKGLIATSRTANFASGKFIATGRPAGSTLGYGETANSTVTVRVTLNGDATLDGGVTFDDFVTLQGNFGQTNRTFAQGDFDYNNVVNFDDFVLLQGNFGQSIPGGRASFTREQYAAVMSITDASQVPEPAMLSAVAVGGLMLARRRRAAH